MIKEPECKKFCMALAKRDTSLNWFLVTLDFYNGNCKKGTEFVIDLDLRYFRIGSDVWNIDITLHNIII